MAQPSPAWYDDPEQPGIQRYWNGSAWTEERAPLTPPPPIKPGPFKVKWVASIPAVIGVVLALLYFRGTFDEPLSEVGFNWNECREVVLTGNKLCGEDLERFCRAPLVRNANPGKCQEILSD